MSPMNRIADGRCDHIPQPGRHVRHQPLSTDELGESVSGTAAGGALTHGQGCDHPSLTEHPALVVQHVALDFQIADAERMIRRAEAAGIADHIWTVEEIVGLLEHHGVSN